MKTTAPQKLHRSRIGDPVQYALAQARRFSEADIQAAEHTTATINTRIAGLQQLQKQLLPFERAMQPHIAEEIKNLEAQRAQASALNTFGKLALFNVEVLKLRNPEGNPRLAVFSLDNPVFELKSERRGSYAWTGGFGGYRTHTRVSPRIPEQLAKQYDDVLKRIKVLSRSKRKSVSLKTQFSGLIPDDARPKIAEAKKLFKQVFIVAEATTWETKLTEVPKPVPRDPIILGFDGTTCWIYHSFNTTSLEKYAIATSGTGEGN